MNQGNFQVLLVRHPPTKENRVDTNATEIGVNTGDAVDSGVVYYHEETDIGDKIYEADVEETASEGLRVPKKGINVMRHGLCSKRNRAHSATLSFPGVSFDFTDIPVGVNLITRDEENYKYLYDTKELITGSYKNSTPISNTVFFELEPTLVLETKEQIINRFSYFLKNGLIPAHLKNYDDLHDESTLPSLLHKLGDDRAIPVITHKIVITYSICLILLRTPYKELVPYVQHTDFPESIIVVLDLNERELDSVNGITIIPSVKTRFDYLKILEDRKAGNEDELSKYLRLLATRQAKSKQK